jgi:exonuclease III
LRLITWNTKGIHFHPSYLSFLSSHNPDIILCCETWAPLGAHPSDQPLAGFCQYDSPRSSPQTAQYNRGGTRIYLRSSLQPFASLWRISCDGDLLWIRLNLPTSSQPLFIASVYIRPGAPPSFFETLEADINDASVLGDVILGGDFNARIAAKDASGDVAPSPPDHVPIEPAILNCIPSTEWVPPRATSDPTPRTCPHGDQLLALCRSTALVILNGRSPGDPTGALTCFPDTGGSSLVDYFVASSSLYSFVSTLSVLPRFDPELSIELSDHHPVLLTLALPKSSPELPHRSTCPYDPKRLSTFQCSIDTALTSQNLLAAILDASSPSDVESLTSRLYDLILNSARTSFAPADPPPPAESDEPPGGARPGRRRRFKGRYPWFDAACRAARDAKMAALKSKTLSRPERRALQRDYKKLLQRHERAHREAERLRFLDLLRSDPRKFARRLRPQASAPCKAPPDALQAHFASLFNPPNAPSQPLDPSFPPTLTFANRALSEEQAAALTDHAPFTFTSVRAAAKSLRPNTAPDRYGMRAEFLRALDFLPPQSSARSEPDQRGPPTPFLQAVTALFNKMFQHGFPAMFSDAHIVPLHKKGDPTDPSNYRGIAVVSLLAKLYATALNQRLMHALEQSPTGRAETQSGFRPNRNTTEQIWSLQQLIDRARTQLPDKRLYCCFVDFSKAFDSVPRPLLWNTLRKLGIPDSYVDAIASYYEHVHLTVRYDDGSYSSPFPSTLGVKQGCPLSPTLFGLFIDQLWTRLEDRAMDHVAQPWTPVASRSLPRSLFYADDLVLIGYSITELQCLLNELAGFCKSTHMEVNMAKTQVVIFRSRSKLDSPPIFKYQGKPVATADSYRYLGFEFHAWKAPHQHGLPLLLSSAKRASNWLRHRLHALGLRDLSTALQLFDMYVRPVALYACELWLPYVPNALCLTSDLERLQLNFLKHVLHLPPSTPSGPLLWETGRRPLFSAALLQLHSFLHRLASDPKRLGPLAALTRDYRHQLLTDALDRPWLTSATAWSRRFTQLFDLLSGPQLQTQPRTNHIAEQGSLDRIKATIMDLARRTVQDTFSSDPAASSSPRPLGSIHAWYGQHAAFASHNLAPYLVDAPSPGNRDRICRLRLGVLATDCRRQRLLGVPKADRTPCPLCSSGQLEDEEHFLLHCPAYSELRKNFPSLFSPADDGSPQTLPSILRTQSSNDLGLYLSRSLPLRETLLLLSPH